MAVKEGDTYPREVDSVQRTCCRTDGGEKGRYESKRGGERTMHLLADREQWKEEMRVQERCRACNAPVAKKPAVERGDVKSKRGGERATNLWPSR